MLTTVIGRIARLKAIGRRETEPRARSRIAPETAPASPGQPEDEGRGSEDSLRATIDAAPVIFWSSDPEGRCTFLSRRWYAFTGQTPETALGFGWLDAVHPEDRAAAEERFLAAHRERTPLQLELRLRYRDGSYRRAFNLALPRFDAQGKFFGFAGSVLDRTERDHPEERLHLLQEVTTALSAAQSIEEVRRVILGEVLTALGARGIALRLLSPEGLVLEEALLGTTLSDETRQRISLLPTDARHPAVDAFRSGRPVFMSDVQELLDAYPEWIDLARAHETRAGAHLPLRRGDDVFGVLTLAFGEPREWHPAERAFVQELASRAAAAYERARLTEAERAARERAERLQALTARLATAVTPADVVAAVLEEGLPVLGAAACAIVKVEGEDLEIVGATGLTDDLVRRWRRFPLSTATPIADAARERTAIWLESPEAFVERYHRLPDPATSDSSEAWAALPLVASDRVLGALSLNYEKSRRFSEDERRYVTALADLCAQALERTWLYAALREANDRFELAEQGSGGYIYDWDLTTGVVVRSANFTRVTGYPELTARAGEWQEVIAADDRPRIQAALQAALREGGSFSVEYRVQHRDGHEIHLWDRGTVEVGEDGRPQRVIGSVLDITARKRAEEAQRQERARLETILRQLPEGVIIAEAPSGRMVQGNEQVARIFRHGFIAAQSIEEYSAYRGYHPDGRPYLPEEWPLARAIQHGEVIEQEEIRIERGDGSIGWITANAAPIRDASGQIVAGVATFADITERRRQEARISLLADTGTALNASLDIETTLEHVAHLAVPALAEAVGVYLLDDRERARPIAIAHANPEKEQELRDLMPQAPDPDHPQSVIAQVVQSGEPLLISDLSNEGVGGASLMFPREREWALSHGMRSVMVVPMAARGSVFGAIAFGANAAWGLFDERDLELAAELGRRAAIAIDNARLYREARDAESRARFLAEASEVMAQTLDYREAVKRVVNLAVPALADWCVVDLLEDDDKLHRLAIVHSDPARAQVAETLQQRFPIISPEMMHAVWTVIRTGRPWFDSEISTERLLARARNEEHAQLLAQLGFGSELIVPLIARGRALGALVLVCGESGRRYEASDIVMAEELARHCALAIDNARLYEAAQRELAERRRAEAEVRASEVRYRGLFEGVSEAILITDERGIAVDANHAVSTLLGYRREEIIGQPIGAFAISTAEAERALADVPADGPWHGELTLRRKDGGSVVVEASVQWIELPAGRAGVAFLRDITERQAFDAMREEFLAAVSHDLRNPLCAIRGATQLLMRRVNRGEPPNPQRLADGLTTIETATHKMMTMIDDMVDAARLRMGQELSLEPESVDLVELARRTVEQYQATTRRHELDLVADCPEVVGTWDPRRLERVLDNLINNAIKYSPEGGRVEVRVAQETEPNGESWAILTVADEGIGIPAADLPHVFERFRRGANVAGVAAGSGIGLSGVEQVVEQHGGTINVASEEGRGSSFTVRLPLEPMTSGGHDADDGLQAGLSG
ncbi:MAG TPA: GAF domain-containing protein [Thermomicrobiales bacterium]